MNDRITIEGRDGAFGAYIARPKTVAAPAVIVLQELFGVNADRRSRTSGQAGSYINICGELRSPSKHFLERQFHAFPVYGCYEK